MSGRERLATLLVFGSLLTLPAWAAVEESRALDADRDIVRNLIGEIDVTGHGGSDFEIMVRVQGRDASPEELRVAVREGRSAELNVVFPESKKFVYPRISGTSNIHFHDEGGSWLSKLFGVMGGGIKVSGGGSGKEVWADITIKVPRGKTIEVEHGVGRIEARGLEGRVDLSSRSGPIVIADVVGEVRGDTGSGHISVEDVQGDVEADTGSGKVTVRRCNGDKLHVDTGSGRVEIDSVDVARLHVDTGSGGVKARSIGADNATIDTGSGSVYLQLDRMGTGNFDLDTGSGGIELVLPANASADIDADTGSGRIRIDLSGDYSIRKDERDEAEVRVGGGAARVRLDAGSGGINISN